MSIWIESQTFIDSHNTTAFCLHTHTCSLGLRSSASLAECVKTGALVSSWQPSFSYHSTVPLMGTASAL